MPTIVTTPGAADANSFADVTYYTAYWTGKLFNTKQLAAVQAVIESALITTAKAMNTYFPWTGSAVDDVQAMTWPRSGMVTRNGYPISTTELPSDLLDAQCEWAGQYIASDLFQTNAPLSQGIASLKAGPVAITYKNTQASTIETLNADVRRQQPELAYISTAVPSEVRMLLVASWYTRELLSQPILFEVHR